MGGERTGIISSTRVHDAFRQAMIASFSKVKASANVENPDEKLVTRNTFMVDFMRDQHKAVVNGKNRRSRPFVIPEADLVPLEDEIASIGQLDFSNAGSLNSEQYIRLTLVCHLTGSIHIF